VEKSRGSKETPEHPAGVHKQSNLKGQVTIYKTVDLWMLKVSNQSLTRQNK
jgi:hypothetical protein